MLCSNNMAMSREKFEAMGGFHFAYGATAEDRELCLRWQSAGLPIRLEPEAVVRHAHAMRLRQFLRQHFNYGLGALHFHRVRQDMGHPPMRPEPMSFYMRMIGYPLRRSRGLRAWRLSALLFLSQAANAMGYFVEQRRADAKASST
jgi:GT2 family glycosyltransferase